jgi:hypothetical protein
MQVCTLKADLSGLRASIRSSKGPKGEEFWRVDFVISVMLGGTSLKARLIWTEGVGAAFPALSLHVPQFD